MSMEMRLLGVIRPLLGPTMRARGPGVCSAAQEYGRGDPGSSRGLATRGSGRSTAPTGTHHMTHGTDTRQGSMGYAFFLSYARADRDDYLHRFYQDLTKLVRGMTGRPENE